jgi:SAM-dependent methyltransferase
MGVMFFVNPTAAFRKIGGALKPGGRLIFACWAPLEENRHWLISYDIAIRHLGRPVPQPANVPSPLAFADPDYIRGFLAGPDSPRSRSSGPAQRSSAAAPKKKRSRR